MHFPFLFFITQIIITQNKERIAKSKTFITTLFSSEFKGGF